MNLQRRHDMNDPSWDWRAALSAGRLAHSSGSPERALERFREALSLARASGDTAGSAEALNSIGVALVGLGQLEEAAASFREVIAAMPGDPGAVTASKINLAQVLTQLKQYDESVALLRSALAGVEREAQPIEWATLQNNLGIVLSEMGRFDEAVATLSGALEVATRVFGERHPRTIALLGNLGVALRREGKKAEADSFLRQALAATEATLGSSHPNAQALRAELLAV